MTIRAPFQPARGTNQVVSPASTSASVNIDPISKTVRLVNVGLNICHVRIGEGPQTATIADLPLPPGTSIFIQKGQGEGTVAHVSALGTTLHIQTGEGGY
jgi:hypothetical protein